jgi:transcriptional regulator with XRE-family HTH domain
METGKIIATLRDSKGWSQADLIGKYERGEAVPSIDAAKKLLMPLRCLWIISWAKGKTPGLIKKQYSGCRILKV